MRATLKALVTLSALGSILLACQYNWPAAAAWFAASVNALGWACLQERIDNKTTENDI